MKNLLLTVLLCFVSLLSFGQCNIKEEVDTMYGDTTITCPSTILIEPNLEHNPKNEKLTILLFKTKNKYIINLEFVTYGWESLLITTKQKMIIKTEDGSIIELFAALTSSSSLEGGGSKIKTTKIYPVYLITKDQLEFINNNKIVLIRMETTEGYKQMIIHSYYLHEFTSILKCFLEKVK